MHAVVLALHSWLRWGVVALAAAAFARSALAVRRGRGWTRADRRLAVAFVAAIDTQVLSGLLLYAVLSPLTPRSADALRAAMHVSVLRFFAVEHVMSMTLALASAHVGWVRAKRAADDATRHRHLAFGAGVALACLLVGMPWPVMPYGRPLLRF